MDQIVYLFGLHHCDQRPRLDEPGESLRKRLRTEMLTRGIELVGEEDDPAPHLGRSIADELAKDLALNYVNLDPNREERQRRGIPDFLDDAAQERVRSCATGEEQQAAYCDELRKLSLLREPLWLEKLLAFGQPWTSMLFVCGAGHIESFMAKLHAAGFRVEVIEPDWSRGHSCNLDGCGEC